MKLTQRRIDELSCPPGRRDYMVFDEEQRGLGVRVTARGSKSYLAQYTLAGTKRRIPLGSCSAVSLAAARDAVRAIQGDAAKGIDTAQTRKVTKQMATAEALTLALLIDRWEKLHLSAKRENYTRAATSALRRIFNKYLDRSASILSREAVVRIVDGLSVEQKNAMASAITRYGSALFGWAIRRGMLAENPFQHLPVAPAVKRDRVLLNEEIRRVWIATEEPSAFNGIVRILLLTGQRREEVAGMAWDELAPDLSTWIIPAQRAKNGVSQAVPLARQSQAIIWAIRNSLGVHKDNPLGLVFPGERGLFSGWSKSKARLDRKCGVTEWTLHDLRRTTATGLQRLGVRLEVTEAVLNHVSGSRAGIVGIYQRHDWATEKRVALEAWGAHVATILEAKEADRNVGRFDGR